MLVASVPCLQRTHRQQPVAPSRSAALGDCKNGMGALRHERTYERYCRDTQLQSDGSSSLLALQRFREVVRPLTIAACWCFVRTAYADSCSE